LNEFGLARRDSRLAGEVEVGKREVRLDPTRRQVEGRARHADLLRLRPQRREPLGEGRVGGGGGGGEREAEEARDG
jgi:hypothetical protein